MEGLLFSVNFLTARNREQIGGVGASEATLQAATKSNIPN
jgi:hypothetical protein